MPGKNLHIRTFLSPFLIILLTAAAFESLEAQVKQPAVSPRAKITEEVGLTDITIDFGRPAVNGREIWGALVPYGFAEPFPNFGNGKPYPWRAGANQNTTISFEHDVLVEGQHLAAGDYSIHMIPSEGEWIVIFNKETGSWGSFFYEDSEDALRVNVTPREAPFQERLTYEFLDQDGEGGVTIGLIWADKMIPFRVRVDNYHGVVLAEMEDNLFHRAGFNWQNYATLANYSVTNNVDLEKGKVWADRAIAANRTFVTQSLTARFMLRDGRVEEADSVMAPLIDKSTENQLNLYGYQLMGMGFTRKALEIFQLNVQRHPDSWNPYDSLAECYANLGDTDSALKYYRTALEMLPDGDQFNETRIKGILAGLETPEG